MKKRCIYLFVLILGIISSKAEDIQPGTKKIEKFVSEQGFFQNTVLDITSDDNGYLWLATSNGLVRYDGYSFEYFYHDFQNHESIPGNLVKHLLKVSGGKLFIGTSQGLCVYLTDKEQFVPLKNTIRNVSFMKEGPRKNIWVGKASKLHIFKSDKQLPERIKKTATINLSKQLKGAQINDLEFLTDSVALVVTRSAIFKVIYHESQSDSTEVHKLQFDYGGGAITKIIKKENTVWIGTHSGIYQAFSDNNKLTIIRRFFNSGNNNFGQKINVLDMFIDNEKNLWIGTTLNGVLKYDNKIDGFISYQFDSKNYFGLTSNRINCFYEDAFGVMWIGTAQGGLNKLDKNQKPFFNYTHNPYDNQSLTSNLITDITEGKHGHIWISFFDNTICRTVNEINISNGERIRFERLEKQFEELKNNVVVRIFQDNQGFWWIGTHQGLYLYDEDNEQLKKVLIKLDGKIYLSSMNRVITQINENQILIGGKNVFVLNNPWEAILNNKPVTIENRLFNIGEQKTVNDFVKDSFGNFWFATGIGIYRLVKEDGKFVVKNHLSTTTGNDSLKLSHNSIFSVHVNRNKDIWAGTFGGGLIKIQLDPAGNPEKCKIFHKEDGLPDEAVYGILEDETGKFWMSTDMGICHFDPVSEKFEVYDINDGILNNNFRQSCYLKTKSGIMLMGGLNGLTVFDPKQIVKNEILPKVIISRLKINEQPVVAGGKTGEKIILENLISDTKELVLDHRNRNISLDIIVQHNSAPQKNRLSYMLEGVNPDWIEVDEGKTTATYTNLNAGTYRFLYKGANGDGIWTKNTGELIIRVLAPWYARWWSLTILAILVLLSVYGIFRYLIRLEKLKQKLKFEQLDKERVHEMDQAKLRFFTTISHEFKTPLSLIIGPLEKIAEHNKRKTDQKYFSIIQNNILRLQRLVEQLISYRKAETGHLELKYTKTTLGDFIYPLMEAFEENAKRANVNFYSKVQAPNRQVILDIDKIEHVLLNLFSNAVKFSDLNGEVTIEVGFKDGSNKEMLFIEVSDTGIGIPPEKIDKIFDRFYRAVDDRENWSGTGIGLALCKSLIDLMKGTISVESVQGKKTVFKIELPFDENRNGVSNKEIDQPRKFVTDWMPPEQVEIEDVDADKNLPSLLIIDDEKDVRSFLFEAFKNKYKITLAVDGEDGLIKINDSHPQMVICDVMMPKLNGYQVCEKIKSNSQTCHIPVILLTALDESANKIDGLELGADAYITKPFSIKHLEVRVKKLIENKQHLFDYFSKNSTIPESELNMPERDRKFLKEVSASIEKNMSDSGFGVEELAREIGMSTSYFYRRLKQLTGQVPNVYIRNFRFQKAAEIIKENPGLNANEVMYEIGIESQSYFSTSFKKLHGVSPSGYTKKQKG